MLSRGSWPAKAQAPLPALGQATPSTAAVANSGAKGIQALQRLHAAGEDGASTRMRGCRKALIAGGLLASHWASSRQGSLRARRARQQRTSLLAAEREKQVVSFVDPATGTDVLIVGCMHFNPHSIEKAAGITKSLAESGKLGAVVLETCQARWDRVQNMQPVGSPLRDILDNELQAAAEVAVEARRPVLLGDQDFAVLGDSAKKEADSAIADLLNPPDGWINTASSLLGGLQRLIDQRIQKKPNEKSDADAGAGDALGPLDLLDVELLKGLPVTLVRYPLSVALRAPLLLATLFVFFAMLLFLDDSSLGFVGDFISIITEIILLRVLLGPALKNRDSILADSISTACKEQGGRGRTIVAVLGAAHCNGVRRLMLEGETEDRKVPVWVQ